MTPEEFVSRYPTLYHMAEEGAWPSIQRHSLLSTAAIVDLFQPTAGVRDAILSEVRRSSIILRRDGFDDVTVRDQLPLKFLDACLKEGVSRQAFLDALNGRVYFWVAEERLERLLNARAYRGRRHLILSIDTRELLAAYAPQVDLAPYNTGSAHVPNAPKRGPDVFTPLADYPFEFWRQERGRGGEPVVELTVRYAVPDILKFTQRAELRTLPVRP
ncbi:hypothetical protein [Mycobacterium sp. TY814]|uniref:DUF7002 family protein n=1 Tax=unclassified Mycobacterium TaxID=2642494 RepID=UPI0027412D9D|nr:hypothetical protein [Mycobacterium sp. TY814]MDP7724193.1 hypothetical protein [Mycobacterium sp. TY814]